MFLLFSNGFTDKHTVVPNFNLVNQESLEKILKAKVFIHKDGQLRAAHLILNYALISSSFQAPKWQIKEKGPHLHQISVVVLGFLTTDPILEGIAKVALSFQRATEEEETPSQPMIKKEEEVVEVSDSEDDF